MMDRDELLAFTTWLVKDEFGEGREEEIVDKYLAERGVQHVICEIQEIP